MLKAELVSGQVDVPINPQPIINVFLRPAPTGLQRRRVEGYTLTSLV